MLPSEQPNPTDPEYGVASFFDLTSMEEVLREECFDSKEMLKTLISLFRSSDPKVVLAAGKDLRNLLKDNALLNGLIGTASQSKEFSSNGEEVRTIQSVTSHRILDAARARRTEDSRRLRPRVIPPYAQPGVGEGPATLASPEHTDGVQLHGPISGSGGVPQPIERQGDDGPVGEPCPPPPD
jgi:hypothetical protein